MLPTFVAASYTPPILRSIRRRASILPGVALSIGSTSDCVIACSNWLAVCCCRSDYHELTRVLTSGLI